MKNYPPEAVADTCGVPAADIREAARIIGESRRLVSTVLQGVYQSHQATAAAVQVNNITLLRGMIGTPGCTVFQMNGQPTAQNTRETGANGDFPGMRNWANEDHVAEVAALWNVEPSTIPHWGPPTHTMQIFRYAEEGAREETWFVAGVRKVHRTLATLINGLVDAGLVLERLVEPSPSEHWLREHPNWDDERRRPIFLLARARKP